MRIGALFSVAVFIGLFFFLDWSVIHNILPILEAIDFSSIGQKIYWAINVGLPVLLFGSFVETTCKLYHTRDRTKNIVISMTGAPRRARRFSATDTKISSHFSGVSPHLPQNYNEVVICYIAERKKPETFIREGDRCATQKTGHQAT